MVKTMTTRRNVLLGAAFGVLAGAGALTAFTASGAPNASSGTFPVNHTDEEWRHLLSPAAYDVLRNAGTESPYSSPLNDEHRTGTYGCSG
jgi:peptide-methionine (R)-S-oxide reductase